MTNHGPARADDVRLRLLNDDGSESTSLDLLNYALDPFHVTMIWPGQSLQFGVIVPWGASPPHRVEVSWKDKRAGRQTRD